MKVGIAEGYVGVEVERLHRVLGAAGFAPERGEREARRFGATTVSALRGFQRERGLPETGRLDLETVEQLLELERSLPVEVAENASTTTAAQTNPRDGAVTGTLVDEDGSAVERARVELFELRLRTEQKIADGLTTQKGTFAFKYRRTRIAPNLFVRACDDDGVVLAQSATTYAAGQSVIIDFTTAKDGVVRALSTFVSLEREVSGHLDGASILSLQENSKAHDLEFLADAAGASFTSVASLFIAHVLGHANALRPLTIFGILSQGIPPTLAASLSSLPATGIDSTFTGNVLSGVLAHPRAALSQTLTAALAANVLPPSYAKTMDDELGRLDDLRATAVGSAPFGGGTSTLNQLLTAGSVSQLMQTAFLQAYSASGGQVAAALASLAGNASIPPTDFTTLSSTIAASQLFSGNAILVGDTLQKLSSGALANVPSLALLSTTDWVTRITALDPAGASLPPLATGDSPTARIAAFAASLTTQIATAFPTMAFAGALQTTTTIPLTTRTEMASLLIANPTFDLEATNIDQFVSASKTPIVPELVTELKSVQRVARIAPDTSTRVALTTAGHTSAQKIYATGYSSFVANMSTALGGEANAAQVFSQAEFNYASSLTTFTKYHASFNPFPIHIWPITFPTPNDLKSLPTLQSLFGSLDYCQCPDCRSVYSPAAYLTDLLHWLSKRTASSGQTVLDVLFARRPDLGNIALSCDNTNTTLPYIDLVNEILEAAIAGGWNVPVLQTTGTIADRLALPPNLNPAAYWNPAPTPTSPQTTSSAPFPLTLPFELPFAQTVAYLGALGTSLPALMTLFQGTTGGPSAGALAGATLGVNPGLRAIITASDDYQPWQRWGFSATSETVVDPNTELPYPDPAGGPTPPSMAWDVALGKVPVLLQRTGLSLSALLQLLDTQWVTLGSVTLNLGTKTINGKPIILCDTESMTFAGLTDDVLNRAQRFLRLWTASGLQMWELDWALEPPTGTAAPRTVDDGFLTYLTGARAVQSALSLPFQEVLSFWCPLETRDATNHLGPEDVTVPSTYTNVFLNTSVQQAGGTVFGTPQTGVAGLQTTLPILPPSGTAATAQSAASAITAALGLSVDDMTAIFNAVAPGTSPTLTLANLSVLFCYARLSSALKLSVPDLLLWMQLVAPAATIGASTTTAVPFGTGATPATTLEFLRRLRVLQGTGIAVHDLDYLLRNQSLAETSVLFTQDQATTAFAAITAAFAKAPSITVVPPAPSPQTNPPTVMVPQILPPTPDSLGLDRITAIFVQTLAAATGAPSSVVTLLLSQSGLLPATGAPPAWLATYFPPATPPPPASPPWTPPAPPANVVSAFIAIAKGAALYLALRPTVPQFGALISFASAGGWLDPSALPVAASASASPYAAFEALLFALALDRRQASSGCSLFAVYSGTATLPPSASGAATPPPATPLGFLAQAMNASLADMTTVVQVFGATVPSFGTLTATQIAPAPSPSLASVAVLHAIGAVLDVCSLYSVNAATLWSIASGFQTVDTTGASQPAATAAFAALQAQYPQSAWNAAITPVANTLRTQRRDALVGCLLAWGPATPSATTGGAATANPSTQSPPVFVTTDDIFDYYLIDPEMSAGGQTTRLLQGSLSIQQFVQQCYLNLVDDVTIDPSDTQWNEWSWMQQYRLWQANREVFLYPENYLLPEVRSNQSPFFATLVQTMRQGNYDADSAESAFEAYLRSLVQVSRLVVGGHYNQVNADTSATLHVFARTRGTPPQWFYRQRQTPVGGSSTWTPWQTLNFDIGDAEVLPFIRDQRLHIVWPTFKSVGETASKQDNPTGKSTVPPPATSWAIQFSMSEYSAGQWQPKVTFDERMYFDGVFFGPIVPQAFTFSAQQLGAPSYALQINAYIAGFAEPTDNQDRTTLATVTPAMSKQWPWAAYQVATATQGVPEAPLVVEEVAALLPSTGIMDQNQEPSRWFITTNTFSGILHCPAGYGYSGQDLVYGGYYASNQFSVPLNALGRSGMFWFGTNTLQNIPLLTTISNPRIVIPQQEQGMTSADPFFVSDPSRVFFVEPTETLTPISVGWWSWPWLSTTYAFSPFYHPFARTFLRELELGGVPQLMQRNLQLYPSLVSNQATLDFNSYYGPTSSVTAPDPMETVDFSAAGAYSLYNWELFYHAPMFVAGLLAQNNQFQDAMSWYEYIFNPTDTNVPPPAGAPPVPTTNPPSPAHFWNFAPLYTMTPTDWSNQNITSLLTSLAAGVDVDGTSAAIQDWLADPFNPDLIAQLRPSAYGKATVMKFLDNLIAWGDSLFAQNTMETVNQAEQLYIVADMILGPKPQEVRVPEKDQPVDQDTATYNTIQGSLDAFSNALVDVENLVRVPFYTFPILKRFPPRPPLPPIHWENAQTPFFCIPPNPTLLAYWDTVADRLYKIRNQLNLQGQPVPPALYAPAINPAALVAAAAAGSDIAGVATPQPVYRFTTYYQRAVELANDVRSLGGLILAALEKRDAEALALLRANQEMQIQSLILAVKQQQLVEAQDQVAVLQKQRTVVQIRHDYYASLPFLNDWEQSSIDMQLAAVVLNGVAVVLDLASAVAHAVPNFTVGAAGFGGSPMVTVQEGGDNVGSALSSSSSVSRSLAGILQEGGAMAATMGGYRRRQAEWTMQTNAAQAELAQIDVQIQAANDRVQTAQNEITVQNQQIANAQSIATFLTSKFTNEQLYDWMLSQLSGVYTQAYQLAYDLANRAQAAYQYELGRPADTFVQTGYWNSQYKGLTAGELLLFDLRRMEAQYLANNTRELELTKHISLAMTQPGSLVALKQLGVCAIDLDEALFDQDHPGHYFRRLRSVALTIPCVSGPYTGVNANLSLGSNAIRTEPIKPSSGATLLTASSLSTSAPAPLGVTVYGAPLTGGMISTSSAQNDAGLFDPNLRDERWLPFEGQGAVSQWTLELNPADNAIDLSTVTDVILHVRYTARAGGDVKTARQLAAPAPSTPRKILVSVRNTFGDAWYAFFNPTDAAATSLALTLPLTAAVFPYSNYGAPKISSVQLIVPIAETAVAGTTPPTGPIAGATWTPAGTGAQPFPLSFTGASPLPANTTAAPPSFQAAIAYSSTAPAGPGTFTLTVPVPTTQTFGWTTVNGVIRLDPTVLQDLALVITYSVA